MPCIFRGAGGDVRLGSLPVIKRSRDVGFPPIAEIQTGTLPAIRRKPDPLRRRSPLRPPSARSDYEALEALPQGNYTPIDKVLLQAPGVSYDSAVSNPDYQVRNEYANVQYRINGILLPEGVSGLGPVLETGFIGNLI